MPVKGRHIIPTQPIRYMRFGYVPETIDYGSTGPDLGATEPGTPTFSITADADNYPSVTGAKPVGFDCAVHVSMGVYAASAITINYRISVNSTSRRTGTFNTSSGEGYSGLGYSLRKNLGAHINGDVINIYLWTSGAAKAAFAGIVRYPIEVALPRLKGQWLTALYGDYTDIAVSGFGLAGITTAVLWGMRLGYQDANEKWHVTTLPWHITYKYGRFPWKGHLFDAGVENFIVSEMGATNTGTTIGLGGGKNLAGTDNAANTMAYRTTPK